MLFTKLKKLTLVLTGLFVASEVFPQTGSFKSAQTNFDIYFNAYGETDNKLFADIKTLLLSSNFDSVVPPLQAAIQKEPENTILYLTLGNVYDKMYQNNFKLGNPDNAELQFQSALQQYTKAIERKTENLDNVDAIYAAGSLYYNKATLIYQKLNDSNASLSTVERKQLEKDYLACFSMALPYFSKLESLKPNDPVILSALKEIYFHKNELVLSEEFTSRLKVLQNGGQNEKPYF